MAQKPVIASCDGRYSDTSKLNVLFYDLWTELYPHIPLESEVGMARLIELNRENTFLTESHLTILKKRKFRADFLIAPNVIIEIQGGTFMRGGHSTGLGIERDCIKQILYSVLGVKTFPLTRHLITPNSIHLIALSAKWTEIAFPDVNYSIDIKPQGK